MSEKTEFYYYEASTLPGTTAAGRLSAAAVSRASTSVAAAAAAADSSIVPPVAVRVAAGAGDRCVAAAASRPKRRAAIQNKNSGDDEDTLNVSSIQWASPSVSVSQLATTYRAQFPLLAKVTDDSADFSRGQVYLVHSCGTEQRVTAELKLDNQDVTLDSEVKVSDVKVKVSIPVNYAMDVYVGARENTAASVAENWRFSKLVEVKRMPLTVLVRSVHRRRDGDDAALVDLTGHKLRLIGVDDSVFLRANAINNGWVDQDEVTVMPEFVNVRLSVAVGMLGASDHEWSDYLQMFARAVRHIHYYHIDACPDVFCDSPDGLLEGRHLSPGDDVSFMTSSVSNVHRTCSHYVNSASRATHSDYNQHQQQQQQQEETSDEEERDEKTATASDEELAATSTQCHHDSVTDDSQQQQQQQQCVEDDVITDVSVASTRAAPSDVQPTTSDTAAAGAAACIGSADKPTPERPVAAVAAAAGNVTPPQPAERSRPAPPVSRVKPMVRQLRSAHGPSPDTDTVVQAADSKPPKSAPVPAQRQRAAPPRTFNSVDEIPDDLTRLTAADVGRCAVLLGIGQREAELLGKHGVDGHRLATLSASQLTEQFQLTPLDANKLARFARGWRPT